VPALSAAEHAAVHAATKARRNASAWVRRRGGVVRAEPYHGETLYWVRVPGFHPRCAVRLEWAVDALKQVVEGWTGATGPTGARLHPSRAGAPAGKPGGGPGLRPPDGV
jgi:hypothetical protein